MTARRGYEANTCVPSKRTLLSIHTLIPNGPWMCFLGLVFNGHLYYFSQTLPLLLYFGYFCIILFFLLPYTFPFFSTLTCTINWGMGWPPLPPSWRNFQIIMLTRIKVALWVGILLILGLRSGLNNPQSKGLERYYDENLRLSVVWVFHLGLQPCHFFPKAPTTLASPLYQMQR